MADLATNDHATVLLAHVVAIVKDDGKGLTIHTTCSSPISIAFTNKAERDSFYKAGIDAMTKMATNTGSGT